MLRGTSLLNAPTVENWDLTIDLALLNLVGYAT